MRNLRKLTTGLAVAGSMALLAACGSSGGGATSPSDSGSPGGGGEKVTVGVSFYSDVIPLYVQMRAGIQAKAAELGASVEFAVANGDPATQTNQIQNFITKGVDVILASPVDQNALIPAYQAAKAANIPIISVANKVPDEYETAYVGPDLKDQAKQTMDKLIEGMGGSGDILAITGPPQITFVQLQQAGWEESLSAHSGAKIVQTLVDPDLSTAKAVDLATTGLTAHPDVKGLIASTDDIALGAIQAMKTMSIPKAQIFVASWDGQPTAIQAIKDGWLQLTLSQRGFTWGAIALQTAVDTANGNPPAEHYVPSKWVFIDASNVNTLSEEDMK